MTSSLGSVAEERGQTELFLLIRKNKVDDVRQYFMENDEEMTMWNWNMKDENGETILHYVCKNGLSQMIEMIGRLCDWNLKSNTGNTPIMSACRYCELVDVRFGVEICGANPFYIKQQNGFTNLMVACQSGNRDTVAYLCDLDGMNTEFINLQRLKSGQTALWSACWNGYPEIARILIEHGANINLVDNTGANPFYMACQEGYLEVVKLLVEMNCGVDLKLDAKTGASPLAIAVQHDNMKVVKYLIDECGLNDERYVETWRDATDGMGIMHYAAGFGRADILAFLDSRCSLNLFEDENVHGMTPLHVACMEGREDVAKFLIKRGANILRRNEKNGLNAIDYARERTHYSLMTTLERMSGGSEDDVKVSRISSALSLLNGKNEKIHEWIPIMKRNSDNWIISEIYGHVLLNDLLQIEQVFRGIDLSECKMTDALLLCIEKYRTQILMIFDQMQMLYRNEIERCVNNPIYFLFLNQFMNEEQFNKIKQRKRMYNNEHRIGKEYHAQVYGRNTWDSSVSEIKSLKRNSISLGKKKNVYSQPHCDDIVLLWGYSLVTQERLKKFLIRFARLTQGRVYLEKGVKSLMRIEEKMCVAYEWEKKGFRSQYDPTMIWDFCRGMVTYPAVPAVWLAMKNHLLNQDLFPEISVIDICNQFEENANGEWQGVVVHLCFNDVEKEHQVICEVQLCYKGYINARKKLGVHDIVADYRHADELRKCVEERLKDISEVESVSTTIPQQRVSISASYVSDEQFAQNIQRVLTASWSHDTAHRSMQSWSLEIDDDELQRAVTLSMDVWMPRQRGISSSRARPTVDSGVDDVKTTLTESEDMLSANEVFDLRRELFEKDMTIAEQNTSLHQLQAELEDVRQMERKKDEELAWLQLRNDSAQKEIEKLRAQLQATRQANGESTAIPPGTTLHKQDSVEDID